MQPARHLVLPNVVSNERWFSKGPPFLGKPFTMKKTVKRHATVIKTLSPGSEAGGQGCQRPTRRCLLPGSGLICRLAAHAGAAAHQSASNAHERSSGPRWRPRKPSSPNSTTPAPSKDLVFVTIITARHDLPLKEASYCRWRRQRKTLAILLSNSKAHDWIIQIDRLFQKRSRNGPRAIVQKVLGK